VEKGVKGQFKLKKLFWVLKNITKRLGSNWEWFYVFSKTKRNTQYFPT